MYGRSVFRRARLVVASLATLLLLIGAAAAVVTHEDPPTPAAEVDRDAVRAAVVGQTNAARGVYPPVILASSAEIADTTTTVPTPSTEAVTPEPTTTSSTTSTTSPAPTTTTTTVPKPTTTTTVPKPTTTTTTVPPTTTTTAPPATTTTTTVAAAVATDPSGSNVLSEGQVRSLVAKYFPASEVDKAVLVARCESNFDANVRGGSGNGYVGLFQHAASAWESRAAKAGVAGKPWWDPEANIAVSAWLLGDGDWWHWRNCSAWADRQLG